MSSAFRTNVHAPREISGLDVPTLERMHRRHIRMERVSRGNTGMDHGISLAISSLQDMLADDITLELRSAYQLRLERPDDARHWIVRAHESDFVLGQVEGELSKFEASLAAIAEFGSWASTNNEAFKIAKGEG